MAAQPPSRQAQFSSAIERELWVYGGHLNDRTYRNLRNDAEEGESPATVHVFSCDTEKWREEVTTGMHPPPKLHGGACTSKDHLFFLQGGTDGEQTYNFVYQLDCKDLRWTELSSADNQRAPMAKSGHKMVYHRQTDSFIVFGGRGPQPTITQLGTEYRTVPSGDVLTNELHQFHLQTGKWSSPVVTGKKPPPCDDFTLTMVDDNKAVLFGGHGNTGGERGEGFAYKHLYVLDITRMHWNQIDEDEKGVWPEGKSDHAAVCLGFGEKHQHLLFTDLDAWTLDMGTWKWEEAKKLDNPNFEPRWHHHSTAFKISPVITEVVVFGGLGDDLPGTTVLIFQWVKLNSENDAFTWSWILTSATSGSELGSEERIREKQAILTAAGVAEAVENDEKIDRKHAQVMFIGPNGSGKSSLMDRLIYRKLQCDYLSTGVVEPVVIVDGFYAVSVVDSHTWEEVKFDVSLISHLREGAYTLQQRHMVPDIENIRTSPLSTANSVLEPASESNTATAAARAAADKAVVSAAESISRQPVPDDIAQVIFDAVTKLGGYTQFYNFLKKKFSLYLRDAGGQIEFQEMVSLLVFGPSLFLFVFRADQDLKSTFEVGYRIKASESINCYISSVSTEEALLQFLASVYAMETPIKSSLGTHHPHVLIVATHKDKLGAAADEKVLQLNNSLKLLIKESGFESLVLYADNAKGQVMFAVNNLSEDDDDFKPIRSKIHTLVTSHKEFTIEYPMSYLLYCLELQGDQRTTLTLEECRTMAAKYNIVGDQVFELLYFLHVRIGVIHFINIEGVKCVIMKRPEDLFNKVTDLLVTTFSSGALTMEAIDEYRRKGILTSSAFESVISSQDVITTAEFLKILVHLRIIAEFTKPGEDDKKYFIPCVLNHVPKSTEEEMKTDIAPLSMTFKCKHCPKGLFGVLVTHLMTNEASGVESGKISFSLRDDKIFKDQVFFTVQSAGDIDTISFTAYATHFEFKFFPGSQENREEPVSSSCQKVREAVEKLVDKSLVNLHYSKEKLTPFMSLRCTQRSCGQLHPVIKGKKFFKIHCDKTGQTSRLPSQGRCWFNEGEPSSCVSSEGSAAEISKASQCQAMGTEDSFQRILQTSHPPSGTVVQAGHYGLLVEQLIPCHAQWESIATGLRFHSHEIENIKANPMNMYGAPTSYFRAVLTQWLTWGERDARGSEGAATLEALKAAVKKAGYPGLANSLSLTEPPPSELNLSSAREPVYRSSFLVVVIVAVFAVVLAIIIRHFAS